jgi:hypothetical protein
MIPAGTIAVALASWAVLPLAAQSQANQPQSAPAGWVFTPAIAVAESFDTNVLLSTEGSETASDFLTAVSPRGALSFRGRRTTFQADYRGSYQLYQELSELNAFDQRANASFAYRLTPAHTIFARNNLSQSPSTDEVDIPGVTFRRQGVLLDDFRAGVESRLSQRTSLSAAYNFQWVDFKESDLLLTVDPLRRGGHAHGASAELDHVLTPRLTVGAEYEMRHGTVDEIRGFDVMNALGTVGWRLNERLELSAGAGLSSLVTSVSGDLVTSVLDERRSAPAFRVGLAGTGSRFGWNVNYRRSFMPSFGFGGTFDNEELQAGFISTLTRRLDLTGSFSIRENDPLTHDDIVTEALGLRSIWARSSVSYLATRWMRIEGFYTAVFQDSQRPGGRVNRSRVGIQVVTSTRTRIR